MAKTETAKAAGEPEGEARSSSARGPRSPNFPSISLSDALGKARVLYDKDKRAWVSLNTVLTHLGFSLKLSGSTARVLSALRQFGLLEDRENQYRVTDAAVRLFTLSDGSTERLKTLQECVKKPAVYREILNQYEDGIPSDAALNDYLITTKKFNPASVETFIRVFKASLQFAKLGPESYSDPGGNEGLLDEVDPEIPSVPAPNRHNEGRVAGRSANEGLSVPSIPAQTFVLSVPRSVRAELKIFGQVQPQDLDRLKEQIDFLRESFEVVIIPVSCEGCKASLELGIAPGGGIGNMAEATFSCPVCGTARKLLLPGPVRSISIKAQEPAPSTKQ
jgi:hypothetical protein